MHEMGGDGVKRDEGPQDFPAMPAMPDKGELVFGLVGPMGVDLTRVCQALASQLKAVGYESHVIALSQLIRPYIGKPPFSGDEFQRISTLMDEGTALRRVSRQADIVARLGLTEIMSVRQSITGDRRQPAGSVAYIVRSFKREEEVTLFRNVYGKAFTLISVYAPRETRRRNLASRFQGIHQDSAGPDELAVRMIARDFAEEGRLGQQVSEAFPLADFFVTTGSLTHLESNLRRLVRLTFGDAFIAPTRDEQSMFFAQAAALRSMDLSRQVGAAVTNADGDLLATGCNEVPKFGGGFYWADDAGAARDVELGYDSNATIKMELVTDAFRRMQQRDWLAPTQRDRRAEELARDSLLGEAAFFRESRLFDVIEFGRAVHAEMAAITQAAKEGRSLKGARLYCTTFPCHLCARHIVASGIEEVLFIEPYEKSRTDQLFQDSISVEPTEPSPRRANFRAFVGVAPRRYMQLFAVGAVSRKTRDGMVVPSHAIVGGPRLRHIVPSYVFVEEMMIKGMVAVAQMPDTDGQS